MDSHMHNKHTHILTLDSLDSFVVVQVEMRMFGPGHEVLLTNT